MEMTITGALKALLLPPGGPLLLALLGYLLLYGNHARLGRLFVFFGLATLWTASLPVVGDALLRLVETPPAAVDADGAGAVVVLGGGRYAGAPEYGGDTLSEGALERVRYAARLHRATGLPVLATGGARYDAGGAPEAELMRETLAEFGVHDVWVESASRTTAENARLSADLLQAHGVDRILLVTHAWHMPRALRVFRAAGLDARPAPTVFATAHHHPRLLDWLPDTSALRDTRQALHELLGTVWYRLRGYG
jgi:uncharacterized SAM-binding protein YcdF (DUF218 family)